MVTGLVRVSVMGAEVVNTQYRCAHRGVPVAMGCFQPGGGGGGTQMLFGRGCEAEASKPVPIFKGHCGRKGTHY